MKFIMSKWVFKLKLNLDGSVQCDKARLVAKRFHQTPRVDFFTIFIPIIKPSTLRITLSLVVTHG